MVCGVLTPLLMPNISVISMRSVLLAKETRVPGENHWPVASYWQTLSLNVVFFEYTSPERDSNSQSKWWYALIA